MFTCVGKLIWLFHSNVIIVIWFRCCRDQLFCDFILEFSRILIRNWASCCSLMVGVSMAFQIVEECLIMEVFLDGPTGQTQPDASPLLGWVLLLITHFGCSSTLPDASHSVMYYDLYRVSYHFKMTCGSFCPFFLVWPSTKNELGIYCTVTKQPGHENENLQNPNPHYCGHSSRLMFYWRRCTIDARPPACRVALTMICKSWHSKWTLRSPFWKHYEKWV